MFYFDFVSFFLIINTNVDFLYSKLCDLIQLGAKRNGKAWDLDKITITTCHRKDTNNFFSFFEIKFLILGFF